MKVLPSMHAYMDLKVPIHLKTLISRFSRSQCYQPCPSFVIVKVAKTFGDWHGVGCISKAFCSSPCEMIQVALDGMLLRCRCAGKETCKAHACNLGRMLLCCISSISIKQYSLKQKEDFTKIKYMIDPTSLLLINIFFL
jgi:hypothetical protein